MSKISRFTSKVVRLANNAVGGGFADYAVVLLHCLRIYLAKSYREALDLLSEMPHILGEIGLNAADLPNHSTFFDRENASRSFYCRTDYRVQTLIATALVDSDTPLVLSVHYTMSRRHDTKIGKQAATETRATHLDSLLKSLNFRKK